MRACSNWRASPWLPWVGLAAVAAAVVAVAVLLYPDERPTPLPGPPLALQAPILEYGMAHKVYPAAKVHPFDTLLLTEMDGRTVYQIRVVPEGDTLVVDAQSGKLLSPEMDHLRLKAPPLPKELRQRRAY